MKVIRNWTARILLSSLALLSIAKTAQADPFVDAIRTDNVAELAPFLEDIELGLYNVSSNPFSLLHEAAFWNAPNAISLLLAKRPAMIDAQDGNGWTALHVATLKGHLDCVLRLVEAGANPVLKDVQGNPPGFYMFAFQSTQPQLFAAIHNALWDAMARYHERRQMLLNARGY